MVQSAPRRTIFTTVVGVAAILLGGAGCLFSLFALLLAIGKPYASSVDPFGILFVFILPPGTFLAGIGLIARWRWARWWMILLMTGLVALGVKGLVAPDHRNPAYAPRPGPEADEVNRSVFAFSCGSIAVGALVLAGMFSGPVRREFRKAGPALPTIAPPSLPATQIPDGPPPTPDDERAGWRVGHRGRDMMYYEEKHDGEWRRINLDGEMLTGRAHHVIYFADEETWRRYPEWAAHRRDEIIARVKSRFREPDYEYAAHGTASVVANHVSARHPANPGRDGTILPMLALLAVVATACFWFAARGVERGEVRLPVKHNPASRMVARAEKPVLFWTSIGLLGGTGAACTAFAGCLLVWRLRNR